MTASPSIVALAGSLRRDSLNRTLVTNAARGAEAAGATVTLLDLREYPLPVFDQDLEASEGLPEAAMAIKSILRPADGLLIASPEYNSSVTAALKNMIDWASRPLDGEPPMASFRGKVAGLMAASPGGLGGLRGLVHLRAILGNIGVIVLPDQRAVGGAHDAFDESGVLKDEKTRTAIEAIGAEVATAATRLRS